MTQLDLDWMSPARAEHLPVAPKSRVPVTATDESGLATHEPQKRGRSHTDPLSVGRSAGSSPVSRDYAIERRDDGIARAHEHAESDEPGWTEQAIELVVRYAGIHAPNDFLMEDARAYAYACGLSRPDDGRSWGKVPQIAAKRGLLVKVGAAPAKSSNLSLKYTWRRA